MVRFAVAFLLVGVVAALVGGAYSAGYVAGAGANEASPWINGGLYGASGIIGLIITIIILVIVFRILGAIFWHRARPWDAWAAENAAAGGRPADFPPYWHHGWHGRRWAARQAAMDEWHRRAHEARSAATPSDPAAGPAAEAPGQSGRNPGNQSGGGVPPTAFQI